MSFTNLFGRLGAGEQKKYFRLLQKNNAGRIESFIQTVGIINLFLKKQISRSVYKLMWVSKNNKFFLHLYHKLKL